MKISICEEMCYGVEIYTDKLNEEILEKCSHNCTVKILKIPPYARHQLERALKSEGDLPTVVSSHKPPPKEATRGREKMENDKDNCLLIYDKIENDPFGLRARV